jgi:hypothetical protein
MAKPKPPRSHVKPPGAVLADVEILMDWCRTHNSYRLVTCSIDPNYCADVDNHAKMWRILRCVKYHARKADAKEYAKAFGVLDRVVMGNWRLRPSGRSSRPSSVHGAFQYAFNRAHAIRIPT